jgi:hypothetical protein
MLVNPRECIAIPANLLFIAVAKQWFCRHQYALHARGLDGNTFDAVRGHRAFDDGVFAQNPISARA